jgi:hypothetical protein
MFPANFRQNYRATGSHAYFKSLWGAQRVRVSKSDARSRPVNSIPLKPIIPKC